MQSEENQNSSNKAKMGIGVLIGILLIGIGWFVLKDKPEPAPEPEPIVPIVEVPIEVEPEKVEIPSERTDRTERVVIENTPESPSVKVEPTQPQPAPLPSIDESTGPVLKDLVDEKVNTRPLRSQNLIREFVVFVDNLAQGHVVRDSAMIKGPDTRFQVSSNTEGTWIDPASYQRYDQIVDWFVGLNDRALISVFLKYEPLIDEAYAEISRPNAEFKQRLHEAIEMLEKTPYQTEPIELNTEKVMYRYADASLEQLPAAQKQMLRLGADNGARVIVKLKQLLQSLNETE